MARDSDADAPTIDGLLAGLEQVVKELEGGQLPLERALERFEEGVRLARRGSRLLDAAEERVEMLLAEGDETTSIPPAPGGALESEPKGP